MRCQYCAYSSKWSSNLRKHEYAKHGDAYNCQSCSKSFNRKDNLNPHINTVHNVKRQEKEEHGNVHGDAYDADDEEEHVDSMHKGNQYNCELCSAMFRWRVNLRRHVRQKHENETCKFIDEAHSQQKCEIYDEKEDKHLEKLLLRMNSAFE